MSHREDKKNLKGFVSPRTKKMILIWVVLLMVLTFIPRIYSYFTAEKVYLSSQEEQELNEEIKSKQAVFQNKRKYGGFSKYKKPPKRFDIIV